MQQQTTEILPLYFFFERLRQNDFPLGVGEYERFLLALKHVAGFDVNQYQELLASLERHSRLAKENSLYPKEQLLNVCRTLWLKPNQSAQLFEELFEQTYLLDFDKLDKKYKPIQADKPTGETVTNDITPEKSHVKPVIETPNAKDDQAVTTPIASENDSANDAPVPVRVGVGEYLPGKELAIKNDTRETEKSKFLFTQYYFPIDRRKVQQNLRALPTYRLANHSNEIDIDSTIDKTIEKGFFNEVIFKKHPVSNTSVLLLIDHNDSMVAFKYFAENLKAELAKVFVGKAKLKTETFKTFYFYNAAANYFFSDKSHIKSEKVNRVLDHLKRKSASVIIISDAGAATGSYSHSTVKSAKDLLASLHNLTSKVTWLNPMPKERWADTTAESIAETVAMFEANENGIKNAVDFLKGSSSKIIKLA